MISFSGGNNLSGSFDRESILKKKAARLATKHAKHAAKAARKKATAEKKAAEAAPISEADQKKAYQVLITQLALLQRRRRAAP